MALVRVVQCVVEQSHTISSGMRWTIEKDYLITPQCTIETTDAGCSCTYGLNGDGKFHAGSNAVI